MKYSYLYLTFSLTVGLSLLLFANQATGRVHRVGLQKGSTAHPSLLQAARLQKNRHLLEMFAKPSSPWEHMIHSYFLDHPTGGEDKNTLQNNNGTLKDLPVGGSVWPDSVFFTWLEIGTPPYRVAATIDSGSSFLNIPGAGCKGCPLANKYNQRYDPAASSTSRNLNINFSDSYFTCNPLHPDQSCTVNGSVYMDLAGFPLSSASSSSSSSITRPNIYTRVVEYQEANYYQGSVIQGIVGMSPSGIHSTVIREQCNSTKYPSSLCDKYIWGLCLHEGSGSNGTLTIGGVDSTLAEDGHIQYADLGAMIEGAIVNVSWVAAGGKRLETIATPLGVDHPWPAQVDTGTNNLILPGQFYWPLWSHICENNPNLKHCFRFGFEPTFCAELSESEIDQYPSFELHLAYDHQELQLHKSSDYETQPRQGGHQYSRTPKTKTNITITVPPQAYFVRDSPRATSPDQVCNGIAVGAQGQSDASMMIGDVALKESYVVFDFVNQRMGWGKVNKTNCGKEAL